MNIFGTFKCRHIRFKTFHLKYSQIGFVRRIDKYCFSVNQTIPDTLDQELYTACIRHQTDKSTFKNRLGYRTKNILCHNTRTNVQNKELKARNKL